MAGAAGLCGKPPPGKGCEVIRFIPFGFVRLKGRVPGHPGLHSPNGRKFADLHGDKFD
jgi:hypothetical protein